MNNHRALCFLLCEAASAYAASHPQFGKENNPCLTEGTPEHKAANFGQIYAYVIDATGLSKNTEFNKKASQIATRFGLTITNGVMPEEDRTVYLRAANDLFDLIERNTAEGTMEYEYLKATPHQIEISEAYSTGFKDGFDWGTGFPRYTEEDMSEAMRLYAQDAIGETLSNEINI